MITLQYFKVFAFCQFQCLSPSCSNLELDLKVVPDQFRTLGEIWHSQASTSWLVELIMENDVTGCRHRLFRNYAVAKWSKSPNDSNPHQIHGCIDASETWTFQPPNELAMGWDLINPHGLWRCNVLQMKVHSLYSNIKQSGYITTTRYHPKITSKCIPNQVESTVKKD